MTAGPAAAGTQGGANAITLAKYPFAPITMHDRNDHPPHDAQSHAPVPQAGAAPGEAHAQAPRACRILVVDDNKDAAETLAELLRMLGNEVAVALNGSSAVERVAQFGPDVVLLDIGLPDINGYEVARRVRRLEGIGQPRLIALTGWGQQQDKQVAAQAGFDEHWTKPVDVERLQELSRNSARRAIL
jgi:CheY-like chemotaxis protein